MKDVNYLLQDFRNTLEKRVIRITQDLKERAVRLCVHPESDMMDDAQQIVKLKSELKAIQQIKDEYEQTLELIFNDN